MLHIHRSERAGQLVSMLAGVLRPAPADSLASELIAVHSRGIERWLAQELSLQLGASPDRHDGIAANIDFPFPGSLVSDILLAAAGAAPDESDPWSPRRLAWPVLTVLDEVAGDPAFAVLARHTRMADGAPDPRRLGTARRIADLFDRYAAHRPAMLRLWAQDEDLDADGCPLPEGAGWQPLLWRAVRQHVGMASPAERLPDAIARLSRGEVALDLPDRLSLFGMTALPTTYLEVMDAVGETRQVHLFLLHPSPTLWQRMVPVIPVREGVPARDDDPTVGLPRHPLLASWGRDARELQVAIATVTSADVGDASDDPADTDETSADQASADPTLLKRLQRDIAADRPPPGLPLPEHADQRPLLAADDRTVAVHACHGRTRQVQVLRDAVLHALADDPTLEARDIIVMCPDIETFAPLIEAVFGAETIIDDTVGVTGAAGPDRLPRLRVRLADRALRRTNPLLRVVTDVLDLIDSRIPASGVLDLLAREPVSRRFRCDDDDLETIEGLVDQLGIRWGLDADHRGEHGLDGVGDNTWQAGLDRLFAGIAVADQDLRTVAGVVPYDHIEGTDVDLAGRLAEFVSRLARARDALAGPQPLTAWRDAVLAAVAELTQVSEADAWQRQRLHDLLDDVVDEAGDHRPDDLTLPEIRALLAERLQGRPTRANHRTGDLTVCTLVPMRSVPHRVVCLLGMDDAAFPRRTVPDGDDLIDLRPCVGDRDARTEDRQLLLDALMAAGDRLIVTYTGRDERTNESRPPAVPVGELLDVIDATVRVLAADDDEPVPARSRIIVEHPLQAFDTRNFVPDGLGTGPRPWSFDPIDLEGARAHQRPSPPRPPFLDAPLAPLDTDTVTLHEVTSFLQHPVKAFCRRRLSIHLDDRADEALDAIPVDLDHLTQWSVGDGRLDAMRRGVDLDRWLAVERGRGHLPPGGLATEVLGTVEARVDSITELVGDELLTAPTTTVPIDLAPLQSGAGEVRLPRLVGGIAGVGSGTVVSMTYSKLAAKHQLAAWAQLVALTAARPDVAWQAVVVGRGQGKNNANGVELGPLGDTAQERSEAAHRHLARLLTLYLRGMREPLPLYCKTSNKLIDCLAASKPAGKARGTWETDFYPEEDSDAYHELVLGAGVPYDALFEEQPRDDEQPPDWPDAPSRFEVYARFLWEPLAAARETRKAPE